MKKKIAEGSALGLKYEIFENTGIIERIEFRRDMVYNAPTIGRHLRVPELDNYNFPLNDQQSLQLKGEVESIELQSKDAIGDSGQELTLFLLTHGKNKQGSYLSSVNHNTHKAVIDGESIRAQMYPWASILTLCCIALIAFAIDVHDFQHKQLREAVMMSLTLSPVIMLPLFIAGSVVGFLRSLVIKHNRDFKSYAATLSQKLHKSDVGLI